MKLKFIEFTGEKMAKRLSKVQWRRRKQRRKIIKNLLSIIFVAALIIIPLYAMFKLFMDNQYGLITREETLGEPMSNGEVIKLDYLTPNPYSRPQDKLKRIKGVVIHYTANPGTTAKNNRDYFEGLAKSHKTSASSHFIVGLEGEIIQCIPLTEISYASNDRNVDTVAIEGCHPDKTGKYNEKTYSSLVALTASLCKKFNLEEEDILRHYDVKGKPCPLYFVEDEAAWAQFKADVMAELDK